MKLVKTLFILLLLAVFAGFGCQKKGKIVVASKKDTEGSLLGQMIILMLTKNGYETVDKIQLGASKIVRTAILNGEIDIYPEYTGNGAFFFKQKTDPAIWKDAKKGYETVKKLDFENNKLVWLTPVNANNTWAIAVREDLAKKARLKTLEDLAAFLKKGEAFKLACSEEFVSSEAALPAFQKAYGFKLKKEQLLTFSSGNTTLTEKAAADNTDGVNASMAYGTDGALSTLKLVVLEDTKKVQPVYLPTPIIRKKILDQYPDIEKILKPVFSSLDLVTLRKLNADIAIQGQDPKQAAKNYLKKKKFL